MRADVEACWRTIRRVTGLTQTNPPNCAPAYAIEEKADPARADSIRSISSYIDYDVETTLDSDSLSVIRVTPIGPAEKCYPTE
jgi:hypothetical protein